MLFLSYHNFILRHFLSLDGRPFEAPGVGFLGGPSYPRAGAFGGLGLPGAAPFGGLGKCSLNNCIHNDCCNNNIHIIII